MPIRRSLHFRRTWWEPRVRQNCSKVLGWLAERRGWNVRPPPKLLRTRFCGQNLRELGQLGNTRKRNLFSARHELASEEHNGRNNSERLLRGFSRKLSGRRRNRWNDRKNENLLAVRPDYWSPMASMTKGREYHSLVKNRWFVVDGDINECEVCGSVCESFVKLARSSTSVARSSKVTAVGSKI